MFGATNHLVTATRGKEITHVATTGYAFTHGNDRCIRFATDKGVVIVGITREMKRRIAMQLEAME